MKKLITIAILFSFISAISQTCLPEGIIFSSQSQVDNFKSNYPNCTKIEGFVRIESNTINNLIGLNSISSIGDYLQITGNEKLKNLDGLDNLDSLGSYLLIGLGVEGHGNLSLKDIKALADLKYIGVDIWIGVNDSLVNLSGLEKLDSLSGSVTITSNPQLESLIGLENVNSIEGDLVISNCYSLKSLANLYGLHLIQGMLYIAGNESLKSLNGLDNINSESISDLFIIQNDSLSECEVKSICNYLANPNGITNIQYNTTGCNNRDEVEEACLVGNTQFQISEISFYPNPATSELFFSLNDNQIIDLNIFNQVGQNVLSTKLTAKKLDISTLKSGIYIIEILSNECLLKKKLIIK